MSAVAKLALDPPFFLPSFLPLLPSFRSEIDPGLTLSLLPSPSSVESLVRKKVDLPLSFLSLLYWGSGEEV